MNITYSAPFPIIFAGEEGMLYGKPGLGIATTKRIIVNLDTESSATPLAIKELVTIIDTIICKEYRKKHLEYGVSVTSDISETYRGYTHGLLAALTACVMELYVGAKPEPEQVNKLAYTADKRIDRQSLGLLTSTAVFGGIVYFRKEFEFLKTVYKLPYNIPATFTDLLCISEPKGNSPLEKAIRDEYKKNPDETEHMLARLEKLTKRMIVAIIKEDTRFFSQQTEEKRKIIKQLTKHYSYDYAFAFSANGIKREP